MFVRTTFFLIYMKMTLEINTVKKMPLNWVLRWLLLTMKPRWVTRKKDSMKLSTT